MTRYAFGLLEVGTPPDLRPSNRQRVHRKLRVHVRHRYQYRTAMHAHALVFVKDDGLPLGGSRLAKKFGEHLQAAGVHREALYVRTTTRQPIRVHDLRATFVTVSLANGKTEAWIGDRTGHRSSTMINRYRRAARSLAELDQGELDRCTRSFPRLLGPFQTATKWPETSAKNPLCPLQRISVMRSCPTKHGMNLAEEEGFEHSCP